MSKLLQGPVEKYARTKLYYVAEDASVLQAAKVMKRNRVGSVLVLRGGVPVGIMTERDVLYKVVTKGTNPAEVKVAEVMSSPIVTVRKGEEAQEALKLMKKHNIRRVLVVDERGKPYGLVVEKLVVGDQVDGGIRTRESGLRNRSWLERHVMEVTDEALEKSEQSDE